MDDKIYLIPAFPKSAGLDVEAISKAIEAGYLKQRRVDEYIQKKTFSPSNIGYKGGNGICPRYWFEAFNGGDFVESVDAQGLAIMGSGTKTHADLEKVFEDMGILIESEIEIKIEDPPIRGYLDAIINWEGEEIVCEIKTTRQEAFIFKYLNHKPSPNHLIQLLIYLIATGKKRGFLLYQNRNDLKFLIIPVELDEKNKAIIEDVFAWLRKVYKSYEDNTPPKRPFRKHNKICKACPLFEKCWSGPEGELEIGKMEIPVI